MLQERWCRPSSVRRKCSGSVCRSVRRNASRRSSSAFARAGVQRVFIWPVADEATTARAVLEQGPPARRWVEPPEWRNGNQCRPRSAARLERREAALALRPSLSPTGPAPDRLRIATWNLNSLRRAATGGRTVPRTGRSRCRLPAGDARPRACRTPRPRCSSEHGYTTAHVGTGGLQRCRRSSRAIRSTTSRSSGGFDDEHLDREPRVVTAAVVHTPTPVRVVSVYVPHGRTVDHWHFRTSSASSTRSPNGPGSGCATMPTSSSPATSTSPRPTATCSTRRLRRVDPRDASRSATRSHASSTPGWSTSTSPGGVHGRDASRGGRSASATRATSGCAST